MRVIRTNLSCSGRPGGTVQKMVPSTATVLSRQRGIHSQCLSLLPHAAAGGAAKGACRETYGIKL